MPTPNIGLFQISDVAGEITGMLHGTTLNQITEITGCWNRAARRIIDDLDPQETKIVAQFGKVYDGVFDYPLAIDVKGNKIIDLFPQANRTLRDNFQQVYNKDFDLTKNYSLVPDFTPRYSGAVRTIRINAQNLQTGILINSADGYNTNGTWVAGANVSNVGTNNQYFTDGAAGSVSFQLNQTGIAGSIGIIENSTMAPVDLTNHYNNADEFFSFYIPNASGITSIRYRFGSSSTAYYDSGDITTEQLGGAFVDGWNDVKKVWSDFTIVGSPTISAIDYIRIAITYDGTLQTQVLLNQFWSRLGRIFNQEYYSKYLFRDAITNEFIPQWTDDTNYVNLDIDSINLFVFAALGEIVQQQQGADALYFDANEAEQRYTSALASYKLKYRSETQKPHTQYYTPPRGGYRQFFNGRNGRI